MNMLNVAYIEKSGLQRIGNNSFARFEIPPNPNNISDNTTLLTLSLGREFIAYANIWSSNTADNIEWLEVASPHRGQQHQGAKYSELLLREVFKFCSNNSANLGLTRFTPKGKRSIAVLIDDVAVDYPNVRLFNIPGGA